jgi:hypothetical protein
MNVKANFSEEKQYPGCGKLLGLKTMPEVI